MKIATPALTAPALTHEHCFDIEQDYHADGIAVRSDRGEGSGRHFFDRPALLAAEEFWLGV